MTGWLWSSNWGECGCSQETLAVDFFTSLYRALRIGKKTAVGCDIHVLKLIGPGARAGIGPPYSNVSHIVFIIRSLPLAKMRYVNVGCAEAIMRHVRIEFPHPIRIMFLLPRERITLWLACSYITCMIRMESRAHICHTRRIDRKGKSFRA